MTTNEIVIGGTYWYRYAGGSACVIAIHDNGKGVEPTVSVVITDKHGNDNYYNCNPSALATTAPAKRGAYAKVTK